MKPRCAVILFAAVLLVGLSRPALAQGITEIDPSLSFHGVSQMWASEREIIQPLESDLDLLRLLRNQSLIENPLTSGSIALAEFPRLNPMDSISKGLPPLLKIDFQTPTAIPEPALSAIIAISVSCGALFRRSRK